jgi:hypothetical protein
MLQRTITGSSAEIGVQLIDLFADESVQSIDQVIPLGFDQGGKAHVVVLYEPVDGS